MRRCTTSPPLAALALLFCLSRSAAAARVLPLPLPQQPTVDHPLAPHQEENGVTAAVIQEDEASGNDDELELSISESEIMMGEGEDQAVACEDGNGDDGDCLQRRLLGADYHGPRRLRPPSTA